MTEMETYIGTKIINAKPMNRLDYNNFRGWTVPEDENPLDEGYLVEYTDAHTTPNTSEYRGYVSWSPKATFESAYKLVGAEKFPFGKAIELLKANHKVAREGWNGKDMFIYLVPGSKFNVNRPPLLGIYEEGTEINYLAHIDMKTADGSCVPWLASQSDILSEDWMLVE